MSLLFHISSYQFEIIWSLAWYKYKFCFVLSSSFWHNKHICTYEPKTLHFLDSNLSHSFGSEVGFLFRFVRGNHLLPALQLKTSSLSSAIKKIWNPNLVFENRKLDTACKLRPELMIGREKSWGKTNNGHMYYIHSVCWILHTVK